MNLTGPPLRLLLIFMVFAVGITTAKETCPPKEVLHPCSCQQVDSSTLIRCSNITSMETLVRVFQRSGHVRFNLFALDSSSLTYIPAASLQSKGFHKLAVEDVTLTSLFDKVPSAENELQWMSLTRVTLQRGIRWELFQNLSKLTEMTFTQTEVKNLDNSFAMYMGGKKIVNLIFTYIKIAQLDDHVFANLKELESVQIWNSNIKTLKRSMFPKPAAIKDFMFPGNEIETLPEDLFSDMPSLEIVMLRNNRISKFTKPIFGGIWDKLHRLFIENNPITCDCSMKWFLTRNERTKVMGNCGNPRNQIGRRISSISKADLDYCHPLRSGTNMLETILDE